MPKAKKPKRETKKKGLPPDTCLLIQWGKLHTVNGEPVCPRCGKPAEMVICFNSRPGWAHKF